MSSGNEGEVLLASDGKAVLPIVIAQNASASRKEVAGELAGYLHRITGARFEIRSGNGSTGIVLGTLGEFPHPELAEALAIRNHFDGKEAYVIRTEPRRLLLIGTTDLGASHAAFRFLESLGCRWFFPAKEWEVIPSITTLRVRLNESDRPALLGRRIVYGFGYFYDPGKPPQQSRPEVDYNAWCRHNRMASSLRVSAGHSWQGIIADNASTFAQHPEYLALVNGKRQTTGVNRHYPEVQLCVSNPGLRKVVTAWAVEYFKKHPDRDMVSLEPSDGGGHCQCENCRRLGSISDQVFGLANEVARVLARKDPGKMVGLYAYNEHCEPPSFPLEPNVLVELTAGYNWGRYSFAELAEMWPRHCRSLGFYEYFSVWAWDFDRLPGGRAADLSYIRRQIPFYAAHHAIALDCESGNNWGPHGRGYYIANKLMWNPRADVDALLQDFYDKAFGPGARAARRYYERFDLGNHPVMSVYLLALGFRDIQEASRLAEGRPEIQARLDDIKHYLRYVHLRWQLDHETDKAKRKALTLAILTHVYRTRYSYMNHWRWMEVSWASNAATEFGEPTWSFHNRSPKPWANQGPYTHEETEKEFLEGMAYFPLPPAVEEKTFSSDLVPVQFASSPVVASAQQYQGSVPYAFYSFRGESLVMTIWTCTTRMSNRPPARYTFSDAAGRVVAEGRLPLEYGKAQRLEVTVPRAGLYLLTFDDSGAGWRLEVPAGRPCTIRLRHDQGFLHGGHMQPMYFYVPRGTRQIQYYWDGIPHEVHGPDGRLLRSVNLSGRYVTIPVPPGTDGRPWYFKNLALGHLWFFNVPNYLAASPNALLIPREVALRDGLKVVR